MYHHRSRSLPDLEFQTPHEVRRRSRSEPTRDNDPITLPPIIVYGKHRDISLIIFGEVHNEIDNRFYKILNLQDCTVFVEHASVLSDLTPTEKIQIFSAVKGSDWIWYKHAVLKLPVVCVDIRIEIGLPMGIEEQIAIMSNDLHRVLPIAMKALRVMVNPTTKTKFEETPFAPTYQRLIMVVRKQMETLLREQSLETQELMFLKWKMIRNLSILSGMMVDLHVVELIQNHQGTKSIVIFMGAAHAYRLHTFYPNMFPDMETRGIFYEHKDMIETQIYE